MKNIVLTLLLLLPCLMGMAQVEMQYSQMMYNPGWVNPAYRDLNKGLTLDMVYRRQWEGFEGAPKTVGFNLHNSFDKIRLGVGVEGHFEKRGLVSNNRLAVNLNTKVYLGSTSELMFGLLLGSDMRRYSLDDVFTDADLSTLDKSAYDRENFLGGFGLNYKYKTLQIGVAYHQLFMKNEQEDDQTNIYAHANYQIDLGHAWYLRPMVLYSYNSYWKEFVEVGLMGGYLDIIGLGVSYRLERQVTLLADVQLTKFMSVRYSYDIITGDLANLAKGSHEIGIGFVMNRKK